MAEPIPIAANLSRPLPLRVPEDVLAWMESQARAEGLSISAVARRALMRQMAIESAS